MVGRVGRSKNGWIIIKCYSRMRMHERNLHTKFQLNQPKIVEVVPRFHFWSVGWLVGCASLQARILIKVTFSKQLTLRYFHVKYQGDSSRCSQDIPFLQFLRRISIGRKFGWSDLQDQFYINCFFI